MRFRAGCDNDGTTALLDPCMRVAALPTTPESVREPLSRAADPALFMGSRVFASDTHDGQTTTPLNQTWLCAFDSAEKCLAVGTSIASMGAATVTIPQITSTGTMPSPVVKGAKRDRPSGARP